MSADVGNPGTDLPDGPFQLRVQVRDLPAMRVATLPFHGPAEGVGAAVNTARQFVEEQGVGPAGPVVLAYPSWQDLWGPGGCELVVDAEIRVPVTRLVDGAAIPMRRLGSVRAACVTYSGLLGPEFGRCHRELFAWLDAQGLPRQGTAHQHAYLSPGPGLSAWTVEIRVLLGKEGLS